MDMDSVLDTYLHWHNPALHFKGGAQSEGKEHLVRGWRGFAASGDGVDGFVS